MTLNKEEKKSLSKIRMEKAREFFEDAIDNLKNDRYRTTINRSYYSVLNGVRSVLILEGLNPETHDGIITMVSLHFIKTEMLPVEFIKIYKSLLSHRTDVDYGDFDMSDKNEAEQSVKDAEWSLKVLENLRQRLNKEL